jgi:predicted acylesterase/phospholipase RssA
MTRIALVLGGGASLGSYIGGALSELLTALESNRARSRVTVDVITGSSAGALNTALAARSLAVSRKLVPWIEKAWVEAADAEVLLAPERPDRFGWLDASAFDELTRALVAGEPASDDEPSPALGKPLRLGFTLAGLDGVRYDFPYSFLNAPDRRFGTRLYADSITFEVSDRSGAGDPIWERIRLAATASASFPFAFPPVRLRRRREEYPGARFTDSAGDELDMWYVDGGLFDNAPLGLARNLVELDPGYREADWRYVMVEPSLLASGTHQTAAGIPPRSLVDLAGMLADAVLGQGAARDWKRANEVNARVEILQALVERMPEINDRLADPEAVALGRQIGELAEQVAEREVAARPEAAADDEDPAAEYLDRGLSRIETDPRFAPVLSRVPSRAGRARLGKLIFVLESACGLSAKDVLRLYLVAPEKDGELSGDFMGNFGGFFNREWRANDFRAGRRDARRLLEESLSDVIRYEPGDDEAYRVDELQPSFEAIPQGSRAKLRTLIDAEADRVLDEIHPGPVASLFGWAWKPVVRRWASERVLAAMRGMR